MCVAVLQLLQLKYSLYKKSKINSIFIYKYRSKFMVWELPLENCNTATLQHSATLHPPKGLEMLKIDMHF